jgi:DNA-binding winged helix-turn-helix (wHTH) protein
MSGRMPVAELACVGAATDELDGSLTHFLHGPADGTVAIDEVARGAVLRLASVAQLVRAHRTAARVHIARRAAGGPAAEHAALEAVHHLRASGDHVEALPTLADGHAEAAGAVLDPPLRELPRGQNAAAVMLGRRRQPAMRDEITVDVPSGTVTGRAASLKGRPIICALLACLIDAGGEPVPADILYCTVWRTEHYHPLRHRNTLYSAINRLRRVLAYVGGDRADDLVETLPSGWRLAHGRARRVEQTSQYLAP